MDSRSSEPPTRKHSESTEETNDKKDKSLEELRTALQKQVHLTTAAESDVANEELAYQAAKGKNELHDALRKWLGRPFPVYNNQDSQIPPLSFEQKEAVVLLQLKIREIVCTGPDSRVAGERDAELDALVANFKDAFEMPMITNRDPNPSRWFRYNNTERKMWKPASYRIRDPEHPDTYEPTTQIDDPLKIADADFDRMRPTRRQLHELIAESVDSEENEEDGEKGSSDDMDRDLDVEQGCH